jgi:hypothetical protein
MTIDVQAAARALGGDVSGPHSVLCPAPGHSPKDRSLSVNFKPDNPDLEFVVNPFAPGDDPIACRDYVREKLGTPQRETRRLYTKASVRKGRTAIVAAYDYIDEGGALLFQAVRKEGKKFQLRLPDPAAKGGWRWRIKGVRLVPYNLPAVVEAAAAERTIFIVEGEKDADRLNAMGFVATCNPMGAGKWRDEFSAHFAGADAIILPDNDQDGRKHGEAVARSLSNFAARVRVIDLPGLPDKGDVSDWLDAGGDAETLNKLADGADDWNGPSEPSEDCEPSVDEVSPSIIKATPYAWTDPASIPTRKWLYGRHLLRKFVSFTVAPGGVGKTSLAVTEALAMVSGYDLLGHTLEGAGKLRVWYINLEDPREEVTRQVQASALNYGLEADDIADRLYVDSGREQQFVIARQDRDSAVVVEPVVDAIVSELRDLKIDVLIVDPFVSCHGLNENDNAGMDLVVKEWGRVADAADCAVHLIHHTRKQSSDAEVTADSSRGGRALTDGARSVRAINRMTKDQAEEAEVENHRLYFRTYNDKANLAPPAEHSDWYFLKSVSLDNGGDGASDLMGVVTAWKWPDPVDDVTFDDLKRVQAKLDGGEWRANVQAQEWAGVAIAQVLGLDLNKKPDKAKVKGLLKTWIKNGALKEVTKPDEKRMPKKFIDVGERAK